MSHKLIDHSPDLKRLRNEGYEIEIKNAHLLVHGVPYVNAKKEIATGVLVCPLNLAGERTTTPQDHTMSFAGDPPCDKDGNVISGILNSSAHKILAEGVEVDHYFSAKPASGKYDNYYEKVTTYINILESPAQSINPSVTAKTFKVIKSDDRDIMFRYLDTNSSRAEIDTISAKLQNLKIAIIGLGGTGSYVLDFVAKTPVKEIHLFDEDNFSSHNAFRAPGAASLDILKSSPKKVTYLYNMYTQIHKYVIPHEYNVTLSVLEELTGMNFVFICIDKGGIKKLIIQKLIKDAIPFVDVGIGIKAESEMLMGSVRVTLVTQKKNDHIDQTISFSDEGDDDYDKNIQIVEINALNAALAVIKWKKLFGFYHDQGKEHHTVYDISTNVLTKEYETDS